MGIRIKKGMGYALTDVKSASGEIADERINSGSFLLNYEKRPKREFDNFLESKEDEDTTFTAALLRNFVKGDTIDTASVCTWDGEYGDPKVLVLRPVGFPEWQRYNDDLDHVEHSLNKGPEMLDPEVRVLPHAPHPFREYIDRITGEPVKDAVWSWWQLRHAAAKKDEKREILKALDVVSEVMGYADFAEAKDRIVPVVPDAVRHLAEWGELFTGPDAWKQLRPVLYTYWS